MSIEQIEIHDQRWLKFVLSSAQANFFHRPEWAQVIEGSYHYQPVVLAEVSQSGAIRAGLPFMKINSPLTGKRWISLPFTDHVPLLANDAQAGLDYLSHLEDWRRKNNISRLQLRGPQYENPCMYQDSHQVLHLLTLEKSVTEQWAKLRKAVRRDITDARNKGLNIQTSQSLQSVKTYYWLHVRTRQRQGVPVQPFKFFLAIYERVIAPGYGNVKLAYSNGKPVAGGVFFHYNKNVIYKFGASLPDSWNLKPNHLLLWSAIEEACQNGDELFDWGKTDVDNQGLRQFKTHWNAAESSLIYSNLSSAPPPQPGNGMAAQVLAFLIRHSPVWVGKGIGTLLYPHFAG